ATDEAIERRLREIVLPGTNINTSWLYSVEAIRANYGAELGLRVNYNRYRLLQTVHVYKSCYNDRSLSPADVALLDRRLRAWERVVYGCGLRILLAAIRRSGSSRLTRAVAWRLFAEVDPRRIADRLVAMLGQLPPWKPETFDQRFANVVEVFE